MKMNTYAVKSTNNGKYMVVWKTNAYPNAVWHFDTNFIPTTNKAEAEAYAARWNG